MLGKNVHANHSSPLQVLPYVAIDVVRLRVTVQRYPMPRAPHHAVMYADVQHVYVGRVESGQNDVVYVHERFIHPLIDVYVNDARIV
jgi:hypothetical protein